MAKILDNILQAVGGTPLVRLNQIGKGFGCELLAKCEFLNPGGSVKDRIGKRMVEEAQAAGCIKPGDTLIEPTSGNTGIGMAMAAAVHGYRMIITMPEKMSREKQVVLEALGAEIIRTPTEAAWDAPESHIGVAKQLRDILPNAAILDQYSNPNNPEAHYAGTADEILEQTDGQLDIFVATAGTGGTLSGVAKRLKEKLPNVRVVGVDPYGSILAGPGPIGSYKVEGIGYDFIPDVLDRSLVDEWVRTDDRDSFLMARRLIRQEGLLVGGSSGSAVWATREIAKKYGPSKRIVTILPDSVRNYMTKFMDDQWMRESGFTEQRWEAQLVGDLLRVLPKRPLHTAQTSDTVSDAVMSMKEHGVSQLPVLDQGRLVGIVTESDLLGKLVEGRASLSSTVAEVMMRRVTTVTLADDASALRQLFAEGLVGIVVDDSQRVLGVVTKMDLVDLLTSSLDSSLEEHAARREPAHS
jgi:cystathionine beta-synthase